MHSGRAGFILRVLCGQVRFDRADFVLGLYMQVAFIVFSEATEPTLSGFGGSDQNSKTQKVPSADHHLEHAAVAS